MLPRPLARLAPRARFAASPRPAFQHFPRIQPTCPLLLRQNYVSKTSADEAIEEIQDQYSTAKDEFEIAQEETEKMSIYAEDDRKAAREELDKLHAMFKEAVDQSEHGDEVRSRVGQRIRELDNAVKNMEEMAMNQD